MSIRVGINGFGRMGKLGLRSGWGRNGLEFVHINEVKADAACHAHLLEFDSVQGRWNQNIFFDKNSLSIQGKTISFSNHFFPEDVKWGDKGIDLLIDCSGHFKTRESLQPYFDQGIRKVLVSAPVPDPAINIVYGVNHHLYDPGKHDIITAASCTTNCLAPVIKVMNEEIGIKHGMMTTIHDITNTQTIVDIGHKDLRRARACSQSLIPTSTGSAKAITKIFPELEGKLNGLAVRVPLLNASLVDFVFEAKNKTTVKEINSLLKIASRGELKGILGFEERPLVSVDYRGDSRSAIVDAQSTMVLDDTQVKLLVWYDNEWGYVNRMMDIAQLIASKM